MSASWPGVRRTAASAAISASSPCRTSIRFSSDCTDCSVSSSPRSPVFAPSCAHTKVPLPLRVTRMPSACSRAMASRSTVRLTPKWLAIACSDGKRVPLARPSLWICWRSRAATRAPRVPVVKLPAAGSGGGRVKRNVRSIGASLC
ncbi:hypothetical protein D3C81_1525670 [compost metagenome]